MITTNSNLSSASAQILAIIDQEKPFHIVLNELIELLTQNRAALGLPEGCLHASMYDDHLQMGETSAQKTVCYRDEIDAHYAKWIDRGVARIALKCAKFWRLPYRHLGKLA